MPYLFKEEHVSEIKETEVPLINALTDLTWPSTKPTSASRQKRLKDFYERNADKTCYFIYDQSKLVGFAESFPRTIRSGPEKTEILGLGTVCVHPDYKGQGLGAQLVKACFKRVDAGEFPLSLFQTGVPEFYHKLNCKIIKNKIVNSLAEDPTANPFWDPYVMVYPREFIGFQFDIDLLGKGY